MQIRLYNDCEFIDKEEYEFRLNNNDLCEE